MRASSVTNEILEILKREHTHLTESEIFDAVHVKFTAVNHSTVYRALRRLVDTGKISITDIGRGAQVFEYCSEHIHHHLICQSCGKITDIPDDKIRQLFKNIEKDYNFKVVTKHLALFGTCEACQKKNKSS